MGRKMIDRTGQRFNRLTVLATVRRNRETWLHCRCDCGTVVDVRVHSAVHGHIKACGCLRREYRRKMWQKHGESSHRVNSDAGSPEYRSWGGMIARCERPDAAHKRLYADRGVTVCARWRHDFAAFLADVGRRPEPWQDYSIDRFPNNDGNYEPGNVRWATRSQQAKNRRPRRRMPNGDFAPGVL